MNTESHILMGKYLYQYVIKYYKIPLHQKSFVLGNILPDYCPSFLTRPHYLKNNIKYVHTIIRLIMLQNPSACSDKRRSRLLGILCHFYADFFCCVHNDFSGNLLEHIQYEKQLYFYFEKNLQKINSLCFLAPPVSAIKPDEVYKRFENLHFSYLRSHPSYGNDLIYCMMACIEAIVITNSQSTEFVRPDVEYHPIDKLQVV